MIMKKDDISKPYIKQFYKNNKLNFCIAITEALFTTIASLIISWLLQQIIDLISGGDVKFTLFQLFLIALGLLGGIAIFCVISMKFRPNFITKGISQYKEYVFEKITKKNISAFIGEGSSKYLSSLTNDIQTIEQGFLNNMFDISTNTLLFIGALALMLYYSPLLTLIAIGLSLLPLVFSLLAGSQMAKAEKMVSDQNEKYTGNLKDVLGGFSVIKSFKVEARMIKMFKENIKNLAKCQIKKQRMQILMGAMGTMGSIIVQIGVFIIGAYMAINGKGITAGITIVFVQLLNYILNPIGIIPQKLAERKAAKGLINKVAVELEQNVREEKESNLSELKNGITLNNLSFGYDDKKEILHNLNYKFEVGKKYAIVGSSGSGKSTLLNLLLASSKDYHGSISYDDVEIKDISSNNLYEIESIIQQNVFIFNATILDNITMFQKFDEKAIEEAINTSGLKELVEQKGIDYLCGENGSGLSGGEKQRISIARSLLRKTQILLVDEATAALDKETAYQVSNSILNLKDVMSIVVTHSLEENLLKSYDNIITLKDGNIVEAGTFDNLIANKGYFYSLYTVSQ